MKDKNGLFFDVDEWFAARIPQVLRKRVRRQLMLAGLVALTVVEALMVAGMYLGWW